MAARPGKTLPCVIVGALLTAGLGLGMGTAHAADIPIGLCLMPGALLPELVPSGYQRGENGDCLKKIVDSVTEGVDPTRSTTTTTTPPPTSTPPSSESMPTSRSSSSVIPAPPPTNAAPPPPPRVVAAPPAAGLVAPGAVASAPGGLSAGLMTGAPASFGTFNPSLLFAPAGSPLRTLTGQDEGSPVTTASQVQSMAFDDLPGGIGTPTVVGVLILSSLGAFALRHRLLRRSTTVVPDETA